MDPVTRRYVRRFSLSMLVYLVAIFLSVSLVQQTAPFSFLRFLWAAIPVVPIFFALGAFLEFLSGIDELQQRIQLQAIGFSAAATSLFSFAYGLLENIGLPHLSLIYVFPAMVAFWGISLAYFTRRYA